MEFIANYCLVENLGQLHKTVLYNVHENQYVKVKVIDRGPGLFILKRNNKIGEQRYYEVEEERTYIISFYDMQPLSVVPYDKTKYYICRMSDMVCEVVDG